MNVAVVSAWLSLLGGGIVDYRLFARTFHSQGRTAQWGLSLKIGGLSLLFEDFHCHGVNFSATLGMLYQGGMLKRGCFRMLPLTLSEESWERCTLHNAHCTVAMGQTVLYLFFSGQRSLTRTHRLIIFRWAKRFVFLQIEPFAPLFWAVGLVFAHTLYGNRWPSPPAWNPSTMLQYGSGNWVQFDRWSAAPLPFPI